MSKDLCKDFKVVRHSKKEDADKEPVFSVAMKSKAVLESDTVMDLKIKSTSEGIFEKFPLNATLEVAFRNPQTQLKV